MWLVLGCFLVDIAWDVDRGRLEKNEGTNMGVVLREKRARARLATFPRLPRRLRHEHQAPVRAPRAAGGPGDATTGATREGPSCTESLQAAAICSFSLNAPRFLLFTAHSAPLSRKTAAAERNSGTMHIRKTSNTSGMRHKRVRTKSKFELILCIQQAKHIRAHAHLKFSYTSVPLRAFRDLSNPYPHLS